MIQYAFKQALSLLDYRYQKAWEMFHCKTKKLKPNHETVDSIDRTYVACFNESATQWITGSGPKRVPHLSRTAAKPGNFLTKWSIVR